MRVENLYLEFFAQQDVVEEKEDESKHEILNSGI
jgi:hypothetical protein